MCSAGSEDQAHMLNSVVCRDTISRVSIPFRGASHTTGAPGARAWGPARWTK